MAPGLSIGGGVDAAVETDVLDMLDEYDVPRDLCVSLDDCDDLRRFEPLAGEGSGNTHSIPLERHLSHVPVFFRSPLLLFSPTHLSCVRILVRTLLLMMPPIGLVPGDWEDESIQIGGRNADSHKASLSNETCPE